MGVAGAGTWMRQQSARCRCSFEKRRPTQTLVRNTCSEGNECHEGKPALRRVQPRSRAQTSDLTAERPPKRRLYASEQEGAARICHTNT
eukprot:6212387-Pleurochrysis_carterae.AAC.4